MNYTKLVKWELLTELCISPKGLATVGLHYYFALDDSYAGIRPYWPDNCPLFELPVVASG